MAVYITGNGIGYNNSSPAAGTIQSFSGGVQYALWNDYVDAISVNEDADIIPGYAYAFDGSKYYKTTSQGDPNYFGLESDTYGLGIGFRDEKVMHIPVAGFALAYTDKIYEPGTKLTCTKDGMLTAATYEERFQIIATFWKPEEKEEISDGSRSIKVNGRNWVRVIR